jgi:tetratricopeptide (TPR) repeat protein
MVRAAAVDVLAERMDTTVTNLLTEMTRDESRLVRIRAAAALSSTEPGNFSEGARAAVQAATQEYLASLTTRQDDFAQHLSLGNYYANRRELNKAVAEYEKAATLRPELAPPLVNASVVYSQLGDAQNAEGAL